MADNQIKIDLLINTANAATSIGAQKKAIRELLSEMGNIEQGSAAFTRLSQAAGELQDKMADTRNQAKFFADDMKNLSGIAAVGRGIAGGFAVLQGTMGLVAGESEELQKAMQKVQITMGIIQGIQEVSMLLNKDETASIFLKNIANKLFNRTKQEQVVTEVVANTTTKAATAATNAQTTATGAATVATRVWNAVLKANPLVLLISILAAVAAGVYYFAKATDASKLANDALNKTIEFQNGLFAISKERRERAADDRIKLAESEGKSEKELLNIKVEESNKAEKEDQKRLTQLKVNIEAKRKARADAYFNDDEELAKSIEEEKKKLQEEADIIEKNLGLIKGFTNKYYTDRKVLQNNYNKDSLKEQEDANKKASDAQAKANADLLAKKKEFAAKMLEVDKSTKETQAEINTAEINAIENKYAKELALLEDANKKQKTALVTDAEEQIKNLKQAIADRYGLNTKSYYAQVAAETAHGGRIAKINSDLQIQLIQNEEDGLKQRNETLRRFEEDRLDILRVTTKAIISPDEFTRFTEYMNSELDKVREWKTRVGTIGSEFLKGEDIDEYRDKLDSLTWRLDQYTTSLEVLKAGGIPEFADESSIQTIQEYEDAISEVKIEINSINKILSDDTALKTSEDGIKRLISAYADGINTIGTLGKPAQDGIGDVVLAVQDGNSEISTSIDEFQKNIYGKMPNILKQLFSLDEESQQESLKKTDAYNIKMAALYLDKYKVISDITGKQTVQEFTVPKDNSDAEITRTKANTEKLKAAMDKRYTTLKRVAEQAYEDELFLAYKSYSKGELSAEEYGKKVENIKQKNVDNLLDIDITYGVASQEQMTESELKKIATIKAAAALEKSLRQKTADVWVQTVQASITEVNRMLQQHYSNDIANVGLVYDAKRKALENEKADYDALQANYTVAEMQKQAKDEEFRLRKAELDKQQAEAERSVKVKQFNAQKATDAIQIGINTTMAVSKTVAELGGVGAITPAGIALITAMVIQGGAAAAFVLAQQPAFASGGMVNGAGGPKDDKISARLSNGESVINAKSTAMYKPILSAINQAGGGVAFPMANGGIASTPEIVQNGGSDIQEFKQLLYDIVSRPIQTYVKEASITDAQTSISRQNRRTSF